MSRLSERLVRGLTSRLDHIIRNGDPELSYPGGGGGGDGGGGESVRGGGWLDKRPEACISSGAATGCVNFSFAYVEGESLLMAMKDVALSSGR